MILGVGVDLVDISRMERVLCSRWAQRFVERVFSREEAAVCRAMPHPVQGFAARFAAKEAVAKALGTGFSRGVTPRSIHVVGTERTRPAIQLIDAAFEQAEALRAGTIHVSLSHTPTTACALAVVEMKSDPVS
ncbi:MAG: holo-ACP synthase [Desulfomonilaceae bacterium]|nr:holo-ACP synthase [Desulfomonilaceae bacterium]